MVLKVKVGHQLSPAMEIPMYIVYLIVPVGFAIASIRSAQQIYLRLTENNLKSDSQSLQEKE